MPETPLHVPLQTLLHFIFPAFRIVLLIPLLFALHVPVVIYTTTQQDNIAQPIPTASSFLLPTELGRRPSNGLSIGADVGKYGTFRHSRASWQVSAPTTRATTPVPSTSPDNKVGGFYTPLNKLLTYSTHQADAKAEVTTEPSWSEIGRRLRRLMPYLWPSKSKYLQFIAVR